MCIAGSRLDGMPKKQTAKPKEITKTEFLGLIKQAVTTPKEKKVVGKKTTS